MSAEERLMLMERISHVEKEPEESASEIERPRGRGLLDRILNR